MDSPTSSPPLAGLTGGPSRETVEELSRLKGEPPWLLERRRQAWEAFQALPMPSLRDEDWRRTDLSALDLGAFAYYAPGPSRALNPSRLPAPLPSLLRGEERGGLLVQQDAEAIYRELSPEISRQGVIFTSLEEGAREAPGLVREFLARCIGPERGKFVALNGALFSGGAFVYVPQGVRVTLPLRSLLLSSRGGLALLPRTIIVLERGSHLVYIDEYISSPRGGPVLHAGVVEVYLEEGAHLQHITLQGWGGQVFNLTFQRVELAAGASLEGLLASTGGALTKAFLEGILAGPGARAQVWGILLGDDGQHFDHQLFIDHRAPYTQSRTTFRVGLKDGARSVFSGLVRVAREARQADSHLENRNLLLSPRAKADSIPKLEIESNDIVRCSHASTVGQVEEEQLFYLMSRGLSRREAVRALLNGFFAPVLEVVAMPTVRRRLGRLLDRKLALAEG